MANLKRTVSSHVLIAVIFLWLQMVGAVHAYEHHHDEGHTIHECTVCLIYKNCDDLVGFPLKAKSISAAKNEVSTAVASAQFPVNPFPYHSRAPPANT